MLSKLKKVWFRTHLGIAVLVGILGLAYFVFQALAFADTLPPVAPDEGMNLYQGYLFAIGKYQPYQDYGPWTFQMPVSYILPGLVQSRLGAGMYIGRMYAVGVGVLTVIGLWLAVRRNANAWWAAAAVFVIALNPTYVQVFSQAKTEALVSMFFAWMMVFGLGADRQDWELTLAGLFAGLAGMTHLNMLLVLPLFAIYAFWQYDRRVGLLVLLAGFLHVAAVHIAYWPDVLKVWANILPPDLLSWTEDYRPPTHGSMLPWNFSWWPVKNWITTREHLAWVGLRALGQGVRVNFVAFFGLLTTLLLWPWQRKNRPGGRSITKAFFNQHKQVVFLIVTFLVLFAVQLWAANGRTCQFTCLPGNFMYIFIFGLVLVPVASSGWREEIPFWKQILVIMIIFLLLIALEFNFNSNYLDFRYNFIRYTFDVTPPWLEFGMLVEGEAKVWEILENKFGYNHFPLRQFILYSDQASIWVRWIKLLGYMIIIIPIAYRVSEKYALGPENYGAFVLTFTLLTGFIFSGSRASGGFLTMETCQDSVVASYEKVGERLDRFIPDGSQLYWGVKDNMLLLYLPSKEVFTPQLNATFTYLDQRYVDPEWLYRFGWWNSVLRDQWIEEADFIVLENRSFSSEWQERLEEGQFKQVYRSSRAASCRGDASQILVFEPSP
jgi:hypothetical protein